MLIHFPNLGFLSELTSRVGFQPGSQTSVEGHGQQAVVVAAGDNIYKVFASSERHCGVSAHRREVAALEALGGYEGAAIRTPQLKAHFLFHSPFKFLERDFVGMIEQSRMVGVKPHPTTMYQYADIGNALGEFHTLLDQRKGQLDLSHNIINHRIGLLKEKKRGHIVLPGLRKRLIANASAIALDHNARRPVHGDFHMGNVIFDGQRFAVIDLATIGSSVLEQDITALVGSDAGHLKDVFRGYTQSHARKPKLDRVMTLHNLDLAVAAEMNYANGQEDRARKHVERLQAFMS